MKGGRFEDLIAWQKAQDLAVLIYEQFGSLNDFSFKGQICRAVVSISNNIAEGYARKGKKEFIQFLSIAYSSAAEVRSMIYLAGRLTFLSRIDQRKLLEKSNELSKILFGLIKKLKETQL